ncbi:MAG TPA: NAD-dependent epimerase/dehydratase family protein, partial [Flavisolibacter sp.]|nr:NAD-dependent epimerase/dehydratase family protein [Flavisolibacter sp.]
MEYVLITGGTGLVGSAITSFLIAKNFKVIILTRNKSSFKPSLNLEYAEWDVEKRTIDKQVFEKASYVIHLAGENVAGKRWTKKRKNDIVRSRVESTSFLCECLKRYN